MNDKKITLTYIAKKANVSVATVSRVLNGNSSVDEKIKNKIALQEKSNESLDMQINELASLENIKAVADKYGLSYNNENIKNMNK